MKNAPGVVSSWNEEYARLFVSPPKQRVPNQYSVGPSVSGELKLWVERDVPGARFTKVKERRGRNEGMEREDFDTASMEFGLRRGAAERSWENCLCTCSLRDSGRGRQLSFRAETNGRK